MEDAMGDHAVTEALASIRVTEREVEEAHAAAQLARQRSERARLADDAGAAERAVDEEREARAREESARAESRRNKDHLMALVHAELSRAARRMMAHERPDHTWEPTEVLHEAYVRLEAGHFFSRDARDRRFFYAAVVRAMTQVLIDHARKRASAKHGGGFKRVPLDDYLDFLTRETRRDFESMLDLFDSLEKDDPDAWLVATMRLLAGFKDDDELGRALELPPARTRAIWLRALAQIRQALRDDNGRSP
jgi:RNA polymerase sigma factor (TIGR02999 family)